MKKPDKKLADLATKQKRAARNAANKVPIEIKLQQKLLREQADIEDARLRTEGDLLLRQKDAENKSALTKSIPWLIGGTILVIAVIVLRRKKA